MHLNGEPRNDLAPRPPERPRPSANELGRLVLLVPVWQPEVALLELLTPLAGAGFGDIVVVDDGSSPASARIFADAEVMPGVQVIRHRGNRGKGRALKTGFEWVLTHRPEATGVVTADGDGQHRPQDIVGVAKVLLATGSPVLGARELIREVPLRSRFGNAAMRLLFRLATGKRMRDTQSGLRGLPGRLLPALLCVPGERYEYEIAMLVYLSRKPPSVLEVPICTVYEGRNSSSHFRPVRDSVRVCLRLLPVVLSSRTRPGKPGSG
jgi:glycosyltransferase involved in cell wall biosynthesis